MGYAIQEDLDFDRAVQDSVVCNPYAAKKLARAIGKPYHTLMREANPNDRRAKLGAKTLYLIMKTSGCHEMLYWMAKHLGYSLSPIPDAEIKNPPAVC